MGKIKNGPNHQPRYVSWYLLQPMPIRSNICLLFQDVPSQEVNTLKQYHPQAFQRHSQGFRLRTVGDCWGHGDCTNLYNMCGWSPSFIYIHLYVSIHHLCKGSVFGSSTYHIIHIEYHRYHTMNLCSLLVGPVPTWLPDRAIGFFSYNWGPQQFVACGGHLQPDAWEVCRSYHILARRYHGLSPWVPGISGDVGTWSLPGQNVTGVPMA